MKAERINVTESVLQYLTGHIQSGQWAVGSKIPSENQLTERLGVSRASVRVAIQQLTVVGGLASGEGKGAFLRDVRVATLLTGVTQTTPAASADVRAVLPVRRI